LYREGQEGHPAMQSRPAQGPIQMGRKEKAPGETAKFPRGDAKGVGGGGGNKKRKVTKKQF